MNTPGDYNASCVLKMEENSIAKCSSDTILEGNIDEHASDTILEGSIGEHSSDTVLEGSIDEHASDTILEGSIDEHASDTILEGSIGEHVSDNSVMPALQSSVYDETLTRSVTFDCRGELNESTENEDSTDINKELDDALDEGYMGMECTLERGFSLSDAGIARDLREERYHQVSLKYQHNAAAMARYRHALSHFIPLRRSPKEKDEMPVDSAGLYSFATVSWITKLMWKAYKTGLKDEDIPICSKYDMCDYNVDRLEILWNEEVKRSKGDQASLHQAVWKFLRTRLLFAIFIFLLNLILGFIGPTMFMRYLLTWMTTEEAVGVGLVWTAALLITEFFRNILFCLVWCVNYRNGIRLRAACLGLVYKKLMRMSTLGSRNVGEVSCHC
nr:ATP-binding cassette sub-family C member 12-like [Cherax quadricarinatus]